MSRNPRLSDIRVRRLLAAPRLAAALGAAALLAGCAAYDPGYPYYGNQPAYGYGYGYAPPAYEYGPDYGTGFFFGGGGGGGGYYGHDHNEHHDGNDWHRNGGQNYGGQHYGGQGNGGWHGGQTQGGSYAAAPTRPVAPAYVQRPNPGAAIPGACPANRCP